MSKKVVDISNHNGRINWAKLKADGITGVIIRAGYGWYHADLSFSRNVREAQEHGVDFGLYLYTYATRMDEARQEIAGFLQAIHGLKPTYPVIVDTEDDDKWRAKNGNPSWQTTADMLVMQLQEIERAGYYAMWYTSKYWAQNLYRCRPDLKNYDLWLAQWDVDKPGLPCGMWQYTSEGPKYGDGIEHSDLNIAYEDYPAIIKKAGLNGFPATDQKDAQAKPAPKPQPKPQTTPDVAGAQFDKFESATFVFGTATNVRTLPSTTSSIVAVYRAGESVKYDRVYVGNGYVWISYIGGSGIRRYCAVRTYRNGVRGQAWGSFR